MADNLESNNVVIYKILKVLRPDIKDYALRRGRCLRYIINLAAKAFIFGKDSNLFKADISSRLGKNTAIPGMIPDTDLHTWCLRLG